MGPLFSAHPQNLLHHQIILTNPFLIIHESCESEWQRVGFGPGFLMPGPDLRALPRYSDLAHLINEFFSLAPNPPRQVSAGPVQPLLGLIRGPIRPNLIFFLKSQTETQTETTTQINQHCIISLAEIRFLDRK